MPLFIQYPGGLGSYWGMKKIKEIDWKIHHFVDNLANFYIEISNFRPKKHSELLDSSLYKVCVSHNLDLWTWWSNLLIWHFPSKIFLHPKVHDQSSVSLHILTERCENLGLWVYLETLGYFKLQLPVWAW